MSEKPEWFTRFERSMEGNVSAGHEFLAEADPGYMQSLLGFVGQTLGREDNVLAERQRELIVIAIQASQAGWGPVRRHIRRALSLGDPTPRMILEALEVAATTSGIATLFEAAEILAEELEAAGVAFA